MDGSAQPTADVRRRAPVAVAAAVLLAALIAIAVLTTSSGAPGGGDPADCLAAWNEDPVALSDGVHAFEDHRYRDALVTRVSDDGELLAADAEEGRCAVVFAAAEVDFEPDFGVRVRTSGRWGGLALVDAVPLEEIAAMQREAVGEANATLQPDGTITAESG